MADTGLDLDLDLEAAGNEHLVKSGRGRLLSAGNVVSLESKRYGPPMTSEIFSKDTAQRLMASPFRADAKRGICILPFGSTYWDDEMPDISQLMTLPESDRNKVWDGTRLSDDEQKSWENARKQVPNWAFFSRLELSADDRRAREETEAAIENELEAFFADADELTISEKDGVQSFSATFDLTKPPTGGP